ncbi:hypothetical protein BDF19DRAFT_424068 [Syncephalis fuscata]|nr:hypothetical protein BDF19DRAFT_424068 [Syncephalis fuscata]
MKFTKGASQLLWTIAVLGHVSILVNANSLPVETIRDTSINAVNNANSAQHAINPVIATETELIASLNEIPFEQTVRYDDMLILRIQKTPETKQILNHYASKVDIWRENKDEIELALNINDVEVVKDALEADNAKVEVHTAEKTQMAIDQETTRLRTNMRKTMRKFSMLKWMNDTAHYVTNFLQSTDWFSDYHPYEEIVLWSRNLSVRYPNLVQFIPSIGRSHQQRDIPMLRITAPGGNLESRKRIWLQSLQHAREWISGSTLHTSGQSRRLHLHLDTDRLWRKNRRNNNDGTFGVDMNRNWPDHWSNREAEADSSSVIYPGPSAASEPEIQALIRAYLNTPNVIGVVDIHSYSQLLLRPFGWSNVVDPADRQYREVADELVKDLARTHGTRYTSERAIDLYPAKGIATDWWAGAGQQRRQLDISRSNTARPYAFTIELSPKDDEDLGDSGFILPPKAIKTVGEDVWPMILHLAEIGLTKPLLSRMTM